MYSDAESGKVCNAVVVGRVALLSIVGLDYCNFITGNKINFFFSAYVDTFQSPASPSAAWYLIISRIIVLGAT